MDIYVCVCLFVCVFVCVRVCVGLRVWVLACVFTSLALSHTTIQYPLTAKLTLNRDLKQSLQYKQALSFVAKTTVTFNWHSKDSVKHWIHFHMNQT